jgi:hypothetical protein
MASSRFDGSYAAETAFSSRRTLKKTSTSPVKYTAKKNAWPSSHAFFPTTS